MGRRDDYRSGARFGPEGVRSASAMLRPYNPVQDVMVFGNLSCVDYGDAPTVPGYVADTLDRIEEFVAPDRRGRRRSRSASAATTP